jgi:hypothetical protein
MRKALNENPMVQIAVLAVVAVIFAVILFTSVLKKDEPAASSLDAGAPASATADGVAPAPALGDPAVSDPAASSSVAPTGDSVAPPPATGGGGTDSEGLLPSKGLPRDVLVAYAKNKAIVLLVIDPKRTSDKKVEAYTKELEKRDDVKVFIVDVREIAKYSRITAGVSVSRAPALVVVRPRKLTGSVPTATASYGFRGGRSVSQAVDDALYKGKQLPSYPVDKKSKKGKDGKGSGGGN